MTGTAPLKGVLMIQGTGSHVGKSVLVAALCHYYASRGKRVAPFKAQNMALNSFITQEGGEIGRAQAFQAFAAGIVPSIDMNPILLKPSSDTGSQVIVHGRPVGNMDARTYYAHKKQLRDKVRESLARLRAAYDIIIMEGAGSPAEINLKEGDLVNMGAAKMAHAPVLLVGDIDRGGVFAAIYGTIALLEANEQPYIKGIIINKFRGDVSLLTPGLRMIEARTERPVLGVVPYFHDLYLPEEDSVGLRSRMGAEGANLRLGVIRLSHISNFTDFDVLALEPDVSVTFLGPDDPLEGLDAVFIPGSKNTLADLAILRRHGLAERIRVFASEGGVVIGLCGGYQILGKSLHDPHHVESRMGTLEGLGLLDVSTTLSREKITTLTVAYLLEESEAGPLEGYEIHMGVTELGAEARPLFQILSRNGQPCRVLDGAMNREGNVWGTYLHGIFDNDPFRHTFLNHLRKRKGLSPLPATGIFYRQRLEESVKRLTETVETALDMDQITEIIRRGMPS